MTPSGGVADGGDEPLEVAGVEAGGGVAEIDRDAGGDACRCRQYPAFPARAGELAGVESGDGGVPVDGGHRGAVAGSVLDEAAGEVVAAEERVLGDEQG